MSWQERDYAREPARRGHWAGGHGGFGSGFGGMPSAPKAVKGIIVANVALFVLCLLSGGWDSRIFQYAAMQTQAVLLPVQPQPAAA